MALRLELVHPPKTAATQSSLISFSAFWANTAGSEAPSSPTTWICLPSTPPLPLISSTASLMASRTVTSEMAMVPDSEFSEPTLILDPDVSTHDSDFAVSVSLALLPQPDSTSPAVSATPVAARNDRFNAERRRCIEALSCWERQALGHDRPVGPRPTV